MTHSSIDLYLQDIKTSTPLNEGQRRALHAVRHDKDAHDILWRDALRLVLLIEGRLRKAYGIDEPDPDMIQDGNIAAGRAVDTWDPERGKFSTWVTATVRGAMLDYLNEMNKGGIGSKSSATLLVDMEEGVTSAPETTGTEDRPGLRQEGMIPRSELLTYDGIVIGEDIDGTSGYTPEGFETPETLALRSQLCGALAKLPEEDAYILRAYYGVGEAQHTLAELAQKTGYSISGIRKRIIKSKQMVQIILQDSILGVRAPT
jgi:RNA polymerase sigma factor (sigma-70 family)